MEQQLTLKEYLGNYKVAQDRWQSYAEEMPRIIAEAQQNKPITQWKEGLFHDYLFKNYGHCAGSLGQGQFETVEQEKIREHWGEISPLLKQIADSQDQPLFDVYYKIENIIKSITRNHKRAATRRMIATLQPHLLITVYSETKFRQLYNFIWNNIKDAQKTLVDGGNWYVISHSLMTFFRKEFPNLDITYKGMNEALLPLEMVESIKLMPLPWGVYRQIERGHKLNTDTETKEISDILKNHLPQIILQGPPGTGKTYTAMNVAEYFILNTVSVDKFGQNKRLRDSGRFEFIQFHPSYSYEDFIQGISAEIDEDNQQVQYRVENRVLMTFAKKALDAYEAKKNDSSVEPYVLVIDEINRADLMTVLGELIYALEYRGNAVKTLYGRDEENNQLILPPNLYIIGTMNTADRSTGSLDYAIRRRFSFYPILPKASENLSKNQYFHAEAFEAVSRLFIENFESYSQNPTISLTRSIYLSEEFNPEDVWIGQSYFITENGEDKNRHLSYKIKYAVIPLILEYIKDGILYENAREYISTDLVAYTSD